MSKGKVMLKSFIRIRDAIVCFSFLEHRCSVMD